MTDDRARGAGGRGVKSLSQKRGQMISKRRTMMIRSVGYPSRWPDEIAKEQGWKCFYCTRSMTCGQTDDGRLRTMDHMLPISRGGNTRRVNLVACCSRCNNAKGSQTAEEFFAALKATT